MEHGHLDDMLEQQRVQMDRLLAEHHQAMTRLFRDHKRALEKFLPTEQSPVATDSVKDVKQTGTPSSHVPRSELSPRHQDGARLLKSGIIAGNPSSYEPLTGATTPTLANRLQAWLMPVVLSTAFQVVMGVVIVGNAALQCVTTHFQMLQVIDKDKVPSDTFSVLSSVRRVFFVVFTVELMVRFLGEQRGFFLGRGRWWNLFDVGCWVSMAVGTFSHSFDLGSMDDGQGQGHLVVQTLRVLRIFRVIRAIRLVRNFKPLRLMIFSTASCLPTMGWALVLVVLVSSIFGVYLEDNALVFIHKKGAQHGVPSELGDDFLERWGGMPQAIRTLMFSVSGGESWSALSAPFWHINWCAGVLFALFMMLTTFGVMNVLIGVFVAEAKNIHDLDKELMIDKALDEQKSKKQLVSEFFDHLDAHGAGEIALQDLRNSLEQDRVAGHFHLFDIDTRRAQVMVDLMDVDGDGIISKQEFVQGFLRLQGGSSATDVAESMLQQKVISDKLDKLKELMLQSLLR